MPEASPILEVSEVLNRIVSEITTVGVSGNVYRIVSKAKPFMGVPQEREEGR